MIHEHNYDLTYDLEEPIINIMGPNRMLIYLVSRVPIRNISDRSLQMHFVLSFKNRLFGTSDWGFKKIADTKWRGQDAIVLDPGREEFADVFPNLGAKYADLVIKTFEQSKPFRNVVSMSDERTDHAKAFFTSFALCEVRSVVMGSRGHNVSTVQVGRHFYKPIVNFKMVTQEDISDYDSEIILS
jgi:hypothetical protein